MAALPQKPDAPEGFFSRRLAAAMRRKWTTVAPVNAGSNVHSVGHSMRNRDAVFADVEGHQVLPDHDRTIIGLARLIEELMRGRCGYLFSCEQNEVRSWSNWLCQGGIRVPFSFVIPLRLGIGARIVELVVEIKVKMM